MQNEGNTENEQEMTPEGETPDTDTAESEAPLNRAQRRAQARGKSGGAGGSAKSGAIGSGRPGAIGRPGGQAGQVRFPRTGHK